MAEGEQNPDEPPSKKPEEKDHGKTEEKGNCPDINVNVMGSEHSTIGTSTVVGMVYGCEGIKSPGPGSMAEGRLTPDEPQFRQCRKYDLNKTIGERQIRNINVTANGPKDSTVTKSVVIGYAEGGVTVQNDGKGEITMKCQHEYQRKLLDSTREKITIRTRGMIQVSAVDLVIEKLKHGNNWITITGNAGDGKTTFAHFVLKEFVDKMNVYAIDTPEAYWHISEIEEDRIILLNDIFGAFTFDSSSVNNWTNVVADMFDIQMRRSNCVTKVVFVTRKNILQEVKVHLERYGEKITDEKNCFDLRQMKTEKEHLQILECHLHRKGIRLDERLKQEVAEMNTVHGFPHCCEIYAELVSNGHDIDIVSFFVTPLKFLDKTTKLLFETGYRELFISLVKGDGKFVVDNVEDDEKRWKFKEQAKRQEGSYLASFEGVLAFRHPSIYESVLSVVAERDDLLLVKHASLSVLMQKVRFKTSGSDTPTCFILLETRPCVLDSLAERFLDKLKEGDYTIFEHTILKHENLTEKLITKLETNEHSSAGLINKPNLMGDTMLHIAVLYSNITAVKCLLEHGANPNICGWNGRKCLQILSEPVFISKIIHGKRSFHGLCVEPNHYIGIMKLLITHKAEVNHVDSLGRTPLNNLCQMGKLCIDTLKLLIKSGADVNHSDMTTKTPLQHLCISKTLSVEALQLLLDSGADVNHRDVRGMTPLHNFCGRKGVTSETVQLFLNNAAEVNHSDINGMTPFHHLCRTEEMSVGVLQLLISRGADVDHSDMNGMTPLHHLCRTKGVSFKALQLVLNNGADVNRSDMNGMTPLHHLCGTEEVSVDALQLLINRGANVNHSDMSRTTPFHHLCRKKGVSFKALQLFLNHGADVNHVDSLGMTPFHQLCGTEEVSVDALQLLINRGANVNHSDAHGITPLDRLCTTGEVTVETLQFLLNSGALSNHIDSEVMASLQRLREMEKGVEAFQLLLNSGVVDFHRLFISD